MILGIDASNLRRGGGITHLLEILRAADPPACGFNRVIVWGRDDLLSRIDDHPWLCKSSQSFLEKSLPARVFWQSFRLGRLVRDNDCDLLLAPGGTCPGNIHPVVTMSRNLLPFEWREARRYGFSRLILRNLILRYVQSRGFRRADGLIFLTSYARSVVRRITKNIPGEIEIIPHGVDDRFILPPREQLPITDYTFENPFYILYVSIIEVYKHQWHVVEAVARLREKGWPVALDLVGPAYPPALKRLRRTLERIDPGGEFARYSGEISYAELPGRYARADLNVFASSCENMPNILLEAMASGLPIASSDRGPMPEILGPEGVYFDPEDPGRISEALERLIASPRRRGEQARASFERAKSYSWKRCADKTFEFLSRVAVRRGKA